MRAMATGGPVVLAQLPAAMPAHAAAASRPRRRADHADQAGGDVQR